MLITTTVNSKKAAFNNAQVNSLLSVNADSKTIKGVKQGYLTGILYLAPHNTVTSDKVKTVCPNAVNAGCQNACLYTAGRGKFNNVQAGRIKRTESFLNYQDHFMVALWYDIKALTVKAAKEGLKPCIRLNGTSDISWHKIALTDPLTGICAPIMDLFPEVAFYDYTKNVNIASDCLPRNYYIVVSYSESNSRYSEKSYKAAYDNAKGLAVVFRGALPETFRDLPVIAGDDTDLRFLDKKRYNIIGPYVVGLTAKGAAKTDQSGFVIDAT